MSPQWLPQNIQKRLLLYVLQQLSLFSEIDLPNLEEVSLNNIHLKNISLDPEKVGKLPGCNLRYGQVGNLELTGGVMGGVNIEATDVDVVLAPTLDINEDITKSVQLLLAQSTADLAQTIMSDQELGQEQEEIEQEELPSTSPRPSALSGVMAKAVDLAFSRLQVTLKHINIKVISEMTDFVIKIEEAFMSTSNGTRSMKVKGVQIISLRPTTSPGDYDVKDPESDQLIDEDEDEDDDGDDYKSDSDSEGLMKSMVFTHEEASSIYMSATSESFKGAQSEATPDLGEGSSSNPSVILYTTEIDIEFEGLSSISDLFVGIESVRIACSPLVPSVLSVLDGISKALKLKIYKKRKTLAQNVSSRYPQQETEESILYDDEDDEGSPVNDPGLEGKQLFNKLSIGEIIISITSALLPNGELASSSNNLYVKIGNFNIKQKHDTLIYGGVESFNIIRTIDGTPDKVFSFDNPEGDVTEATKADIRFEIFSKISSDSKVREITTLLSKSLKFDLDYYSLGSLLELGESIKAIQNSFNGVLSNVETYMKLTGKDEQHRKKNNMQNRIVLQTADIVLRLKLSPESIIVMKVLPIFLNLLADEVKCQKLIIEHHKDGIISKIVSVSNLLLELTQKDFKTSMSHSQLFIRNLIISSAVNACVSKINVDITFELLTCIISSLGNFIKDLKTLPKRYTSTNNFSGSIYNSKKLKRRVNISPSTKTNAEFMMNFQEINFNITKVSSNFGDILGRVANISIYKYKGEYNLVVKGFKLNRLCNEVSERIIFNVEELPVQDVTQPHFLAQVKSNGFLEFKCQNMVFEVYSNWQKLFGDNNDSEINTGADSGIEELEKEAKKYDSRLHLKDCFVGITPLQLTCKSYICLSKVSSDLMINSDQIYLKTTIRDLVLLLIDDVKEIKQLTKLESQKLKTSPLDTFIKKNFLNAGNINNLHIGITYNYDEQKLIDRSRKMNLYDKLAALDIKINSDEVNLELCGDSFYTFTQLLNDLKVPLILKDEEKFKVKLEKEINILQDIGPFEFKSSTVDSAEENEQGTEEGEFEVIDEYYGGQEDDPIENDTSANESITMAQETSDKSLQIDDNYFNKTKADENVSINPASININLGKVSLYMYDGYDWKETRKVIRGIVKKVEKESKEDNVLGGEEEAGDNDDKLEVIEETLFQSIHVTLPKGIDPSHLTQNINKQVNEKKIDEDSEEKGYKDLKLRRSNRYKMLIELKSIDLLINIFSLRDPLKDPYTGETSYEVLNEIELVVDLVTIYDNLLNSTWNKYLTYMNSLGEKEIGKNMVKFHLTTIRDPVDLNFNESTIKLSLLPLRLFIDQDTNEFLTRFFNFNDKRFKLEKLEEDLFVKKIEIPNSIKIKIDYKPKKLNLIGLKNGEFNELLNLIHLNGLPLNLNPIKIYGIKGVDKLFARLFEHWVPNIQNTQLLSILSGVELFKPFINISGSLKDVLMLPITDFQDLNNQKFLKKLNKNGKEFLKTTSYELLKLGYRLSNGTQNMLEQGEEYLGGTGNKLRKIQVKDIEDEVLQWTEGNTDNKNEEMGLLENSVRLNKTTRNLDESNIYQNPQNQKYSEVDEEGIVDSSEEEVEETKLVSLYSNQPKNFKQGVQLSFKSLNKNYNLTKDEFLKLIEKVNESENYEDSLKIIFSKSPLLLLRPMIGTTEMILKTLIGLSNQINTGEHIESKDKYKSENDQH